jgi:hypothetical protein
MATHAHVLDPSWSSEPIPWAPGADVTMVPRLHAAALDDCEECIDELGREAAGDVETMGAVVAMAFAVVAAVPLERRPGLAGAVPFEPPMQLLLERIQASGNYFDYPVILDLLRDMDTGDRLAVYRGCAGLMHLHVLIHQGDDPTQ